MPGAGGEAFPGEETKRRRRGSHVAGAARGLNPRLRRRERSWALSSEHAWSGQGGLHGERRRGAGPAGDTALYDDVVNGRSHGTRRRSSRAPAFFEASWTQVSTQSCIRPRALIVTNVPRPGQSYQL